MIISASHLSYTYPDTSKEILTDLNFDIAEGEIFGFLGPSGAGKSTTQNLLIGLLKEYRGSVQIMNKDLNIWKNDYYEHIGVSFELPNHYLKLTARENLAHFRSLYQGDTYDPMTVLEWLGLSEDADKKVANYSKGMKIRLNVARSLLHKPKILFLDEPTSGMDPVNARKVRDLILEIRNRGTTVFLTTHNMMLADQLCDRVAFITSGHINLIDSPSALKKQYGRKSVRVEYLSDNQEIQQQEFPLEDLGDNHDFINLLKTAKAVETIHTQETTLENIFIEVTGQDLKP